MFERFTQRARQVIVLAQEEARTLHHNYIGTEHILLGLLREEQGIAARVLGSLDVTVERVRAQVLRIVGAGEEVTSGQIPFTPRAKKVLEMALRESLSLGHNYIGTEHILLAIVREGEGVAARILRDFDAHLERVLNDVIRVLSGPGERRSVEPSLVVASSFTSDRAWLGDLAPVLDRLAPDIRRELGREPDVGDLLVVMAGARETLAGRALGEAGVNVDELRDAVERLRQERLEQSIQELEEIRRHLGLSEPSDPPQLS